MSRPRTNLIETVTVLASADLMDGGAVSTRVKLLPIGRIDMRDGRGPYRIRDRAHAEQIVQATRAWLGGADFNFDYNHQVISPGAEARAAGWVSPDNLVAEDDGIYAIGVSWTEEAAEALCKREYRYVSPLFVAAPAAQGGDVQLIKNCALVNVGAIDLPAIAAGLTGDVDPMDLTVIPAALGLSADATVEQIAAAIAAIKDRAAAQPDAGLSQVAVALGLGADASADQAIGAIAALRTEMVPASIVDGLKEQVTLLNRDRLGRKVDELVAAGVVIPAKRAATLDWFEKDEVAATAFFAGMPAMVQPGAQLDRRADVRVDQLTAEQQQVAAAIGMSADEMLAAINEEGR